jgi:hypothetical protein
MINSITSRVEGGIRAEQGPAVAADQGLLLAAALAAALVEYRRYVGPKNGHLGLDSVETNWQIVSRLEQLRSQA